MGVPLKFRAIAAPALSHLANALRPEKLELREGEAVAVNCVSSLQRVGCGDSRDSFLRAAAALRLRVLTSGGRGGLRRRRQVHGVLRGVPAVLRLLFRDAGGELPDDGGADAVVDGERRERGRQWCRRLERCGFETFGVSDDVIDDLKALLKRYRPGWSLLPAEGETSDMYLTWKENPVV
ncbi:hypothetical protein ZIOFF_028297 [Zingiber officinale]|uniref:Uncharacterized protein n=1 Tax=Zingiber officinale TaxID=94328 RepID=A0A8J5GMV9_ZINOF|nr:hypothetical protein ZIOFF_028297 [Zingiber officinale]